MPMEQNSIDDPIIITSEWSQDADTIRSSRFWTEEQILFLKQNISMPQKWISEKVGKSIQAVNMKIFRMKSVSP